MEAENKKSAYTPVKDFAKKKGVSVQSVYARIKRSTLLVKKIGTYTLVAEK